MKLSHLEIVKNDPFLKPYERVITARHEKAMIRIFDFTEGEKRFADCFNGHLYYGLHKTGNGWVFREWAPNASAIWLVGDFSNWERKDKFRLIRIDNGNWELYLDENALKHGDLYKLQLDWPGGAGERLPTHVKRVVQDEQTKLFSAQVWNPIPYKWKHKPLKKIDAPLIYEAHIGMSGEEPRVATFTEFKDKVLPRIVKLGYNVIQLMAIQEHPYYGSFGYQVSNFFAVSSRFGTPEELKALIDEAHKHKIAVVLDVVHSHAVKNEIEGLARFDGTETQFFLPGERGNHPVWDSKCFDYGKDEVIAFLLSNLKYWSEEFRFDGFRFDGVTSMMYYHHGMGVNFTNYSMYYDGAQDEDAIAYLTMANQLIHELNPAALTIAEDVSGMPGLAMPFADGGVGFDYRMSMGVADYWIKLLKEKRDEDWHVGEMYYELTNKRADEKTISYAECHDQAMVGDKTIAFRLMDKEMYTAMSVFTPSLVIDRGLALHKLIRLITLATAGNGYLTFMGNEFGHPEWIDFPRAGNCWSFQYARRQWHLADDKTLKYKYLQAFDEAMIALAKKYDVFAYKPEFLFENVADQLIAFRRGGLVFVFNFSPVKFYPDFRMDGVGEVLLSSDSGVFGGNDFSGLVSRGCLVYECK